jgi:hypothetical protein
MKKKRRKLIEREREKAHETIGKKKKRKKGKKSWKNMI